jgi:hypothetical protein
MINLNIVYSVHHLAGFEAERVIRECLAPFPYIWASVYKGSIDESCLICASPLLNF